MTSLLYMFLTTLLSNQFNEPIISFITNGLQQKQAGDTFNHWRTSKGLFNYGVFTLNEAETETKRDSETN